MQKQLSLKEASLWASKYLNREITISNIYYLVQYGRIPKIDKNGNILLIGIYLFRNIMNHKQQSMFIAYILIKENLSPNWLNIF